MVIQTYGYGRYFLEMNGISLSLQGKQLTVFVAYDNVLVFKQKVEFGKLILSM